MRTAEAGEDARGLYWSDDLMPDVFAGPYAELAPGLAFVLAFARGLHVYLPQQQQRE